MSGLEENGMIAFERETAYPDFHLADVQRPFRA